MFIKPDPIIMKRGSFVLGGAILLWLLLIVRLFWLQIVSYDEYHRVVIENITSKVLAQYVEKNLLTSGKEVLAYARASIVVMVVGNIFLVVGPTCAFHRLIVFVRIVGVNLHKVLFVGAIKSHFAGFAVRVFLYGVKHFGTSCNIENLVYLVKRFVAHFSKCSGTLLAINGSETAIDLFIVVDNPLPYSSLLGV